MRINLFNSISLTLVIFSSLFLGLVTVGAGQTIGVASPIPGITMGPATHNASGLNTNIIEGIPEVIAFPNPAPATSILQVQVIDMEEELMLVFLTDISTGQVVYEWSFPNTLPFIAFTIDLENFQPGQYSLTVIGQDNTLSDIIVIN